MYEVKGGTRAKQFIHEIDKLSSVSCIVYHSHKHGEKISAYTLGHKGNTYHCMLCVAVDSNEAFVFRVTSRKECSNDTLSFLSPLDTSLHRKVRCFRADDRARGIPGRVWRRHLLTIINH